MMTPILPLALTACGLVACVIAAKTRPTLFAYVIWVCIAVGYSWVLWSMRP